MTAGLEDLEDVEKFGIIDRSGKVQRNMVCGNGIS